MNTLCEYGCGQEAKHQLKNGKWCCSVSCNSCIKVKNKNHETHLGSKGVHFKVEKIGCQYCNKHIATSRILKHENICVLNPINITTLEERKNTGTEILLLMVKIQGLQLQ